MGKGGAGSKKAGAGGTKAIAASKTNKDAINKAKAEKEIAFGNQLNQDALDLEAEAKELDKKRASVLVKLERAEDDLGHYDPETKSLRAQANSLELEIRDLKNSAKSLHKQAKQAYKNARDILDI